MMTTESDYGWLSFFDWGPHSDHSCSVRGCSALPTIWVGRLMSDWWLCQDHELRLLRAQYLATPKMNAEEYAAAFLVGGRT